MFVQIIIFVFSAYGMWLIADRRIGVRRLGAMVSLVASPLILISTAEHGEWGIFAEAAICALAFIRILLPLVREKWKKYCSKLK